MATENLTSNSSTAAIQFQGEGTVNIAGTFGGGNVSIEASFDNGATWVAQTDGEISSAETVNMKIGPCFLRTTLTGATSPSLAVSVVGNDIRKTTKNPTRTSDFGEGFPYTFPFILI